MSGPNNSFWNLYIVKDPANLVEVSTSVNIADELKIVSGTLSTAGNPLNLGP
jgi:hypothetical protein